MSSISKIAMICHEANRAYCIALGDNSQLPWAQAPEWQRQSAVNGVLFVLENPNAEPSAAHENWMKEKAAQGWVDGLVKDPEKKTHPCMVPYGRLPVEQRAKDHIFRAVVLSAADLVVP